MSGAEPSSVEYFYIYVTYSVMDRNVPSQHYLLLDPSKFNRCQISNGTPGRIHAQSTVRLSHPKLCG